MLLSPLRPIHTERLRLRKRCRKQLGSVSFYTAIHIQRHKTSKENFAFAFTVAQVGTGPKGGKSQMYNMHCYCKGLLLCERQFCFILKFTVALLRRVLDLVRIRATGPYLKRKQSNDSLPSQQRRKRSLLPSNKKQRENNKGRKKLRKWLGRWPK